VPYLNPFALESTIVQGRWQGCAMLFFICTKYYACLTWDIFRHCPPLASMVLSATSTDFEPMQSPEFMACCFCNKPTNAVSPSLDRARFAHPECYVKHVKARRREIPAARKATPPRCEGTMKVRAILWTVTMAYTGLLLTGQGLRTFNSLSITEGFLGDSSRIFPCHHVHSPG
jgi:hypothetical protein